MCRAHNVRTSIPRIIGTNWFDEEIDYFLIDNLEINRSEIGLVLLFRLILNITWIKQFEETRRSQTKFESQITNN